jgi:hypothetical protein
MLENVPAKFIVPASDILKMHPVVPQVMFPVIVQVPVVRLMLSVRVPEVISVALMVNVVPIERVPPFMLIEHVKPVAGCGIETAPDTEREFVPLMVTRELETDTAAKVRDAQEAATSTVTVIPSLMVTASPDPGTDNPPQVAVLLQSPDTEAILAACG